MAYHKKALVCILVAFAIQSEFVKPISCCIEAILRKEQEELGPTYGGFVFHSLRLLLCDICFDADSPIYKVRQCHGNQAPI